VGTVSDHKSVIRSWIIDSSILNEWSGNLSMRILGHVWVGFIVDSLEGRVGGIELGNTFSLLGSFLSRNSLYICRCIFLFISKFCCSSFFRAELLLESLGSKIVGNKSSLLVSWLSSKFLFKSFFSSIIFSFCIISCCFLCNLIIDSTSTSVIIRSSSILSS